MLEAEFVEALADGHRADGVAGFYAHVRGVGFGFLEDDLVADAFDDGVDGVAESLEGFAGEAAGAGFVAGEGALVEQDDMLAGLREVVGCGATSGSGTDDESVYFANHCWNESIRSARDRRQRGELWIRGTKGSRSSYRSGSRNGDAACSERLSSDLLRGARWWLC